MFPACDADRDGLHPGIDRRWLVFERDAPSGADVRLRMRRDGMITLEMLLRDWMFDHAVNSGMSYMEI